MGLAILLMNRMALARTVEIDQVDLTRAVVDVAQLVRETVSDLGYTVLEGRDVTVAPAAVVLCDVDATAVREMVFNLLSNAARYSEAPASILVTVDRIGDSAHLVFRDHGVGVADADAEWIFEKFNQSDSLSPGVGLGLFISRGLARAHGGEITVDPAPDRGSEFTLTLPAVA